jgi:serine/threonine protein kinase
MTALQRGQRLGSYVVEDLLGQGGMAEVYRATHTTLERHDAIKVLNPALNVDPTFPLRFEREAKTSARLRHPNIITVYDFGEQGDIAYLAMELATGGTFQERVGRFPTLVEAVEALEPICNAIEYAHSQGVIHRDLKPENILLDETQRRLLADFGLARIAAESIDLAESGLIVGTPQYMSPEQAMAAKVDHRADIYALGFIAYAAITGRVPYDARTFFGVIQQHLKSPPPSIAAVLPGIPAALDAAIRRATAKRPEDRFNRAAEFYAALRDAAETARDQRPRW